VVDEQSELLRPTDGDISGLAASQDLVNLLGHVPEEGPGIDGVRHQSNLGGWEHTEIVEDWQSPVGSEFDDLMSIEPRGAIAERQQSANALRDRIVKRDPKITGAFPFGAVEAEACLLGCGLDLGPVRHPIRGGLVENADVGEFRYQFFEQFEPPRSGLRREIDRASRVASRTIQSGDLGSTAFDVVAPDYERNPRM
jgi:hypothetical protein